MSKRGFSEDILNQLEKLSAKYDAMGQDLSSYLDGLLHADYLTYWDYIHLDTLLSLQKPKTSFPDEQIFILYHQITELYFKLILNELDQLILSDTSPSKGDFILRVKRINRYFDHLIDSFDVMIDGMDKEQFLNFRMSLLPSSGFQSGQYRQIEIGSTDLCHLSKSVDGNNSMDESFQNLYWRRGATELASGKKTLTLEQFEKKYDEQFLKRAKQTENSNLNRLYLNHFAKDDEVIELLRSYDYKANVSWPMMHYKSAVRYLHRDPVEIEATGGTNWQKYLPPRRQQIRFFPTLWTETEISDWGTREEQK